MAETYQAAAPRLSSPSKTTPGLVVVAYHFLIAAGLTGTLVIAAVMSLARLRNDPQGIIGVLLSCLVLCWLSISAFKLVFQRGGGAQ